MPDRFCHVRRGRSKNLTFDFDALELLNEMAPAHKAQGRFLSELLRKEKALREERARIKRELEHVLT